MKKIVYSLQIVVLIFCVQCKSVPLTQRSQLSLIGNNKIFPSSFDQYEQVKAESAIITDTKEANMVKQAGLKIQRAVEQYFQAQGQADYTANYRWEYNLLKDDNTVNAWCMPGGKVAFYTGIMPICRDELGVAVVMGHEIAHAIANHGRERISQQYSAQFGLSVLDAVLSNGTSASTSIPSDIIMQGAGAATSVGILAFSRKHESESDELGLYFMAMAGYDPRVAPSFWERMSKQSSGSAPPEFLSTHPSHGTRIAHLKEIMPKALEHYNKARNR